MVRIDGAIVGGGLLLAGLVHLLVPESLLRAASYAYRRSLAVEFSSSERSKRRIRAVGLLMLAVGTIAAAGERSVSVAIERT
ncbi:MAG: hypothetical protein QXG03_04090 [Halalkalicoccus sp.]